MILASSIATPIVLHAKTYTGYRPKPVAPIYPPERYVGIILKEAKHPRTERVVGGFGHAAVMMSTNFPRFTRWYQALTGFNAQKTREPKGVNDGDNLFASLPGTYRVRGPDPVSERINFIENRRGAIAMGVVGLGALALAATWRKRTAHKAEGSVRSTSYAMSRAREYHLQ